MKLSADNSCNTRYKISKPGVRRYLLLGACSLVLAACVSQGKYDKLAQERDALLNEKQQLKKNVSVTSKELEAIKARQAEQEALFANLKKELASELDSKKLTIQQMKDGIHVNLTEDILFPSGSAEVRESGREVLGKVSGQLGDAKYQIVVSGFTDNVPISRSLSSRFPTNWDLAAARATNVVRLLEENNVPSDKLIATSYGKNKPISSNETEEGRKQNRRIEIHLRPIAVEE